MFFAGTKTSQEQGLHLLRTPECLRIGAELSAREDAYFGHDFAWGRENIERWVQSGCMFYTAVALPGETGRRRIGGLVSVLVAGEESCMRLLSGQIREQELLPWFQEKAGSSPCLYFSSVLSDSPQYLPSLYIHLQKDLEAYLNAQDLKPRAGLSIAVGPAGFQHMSKNGFVAVNGPCYLHKYQFMRIDATTAKTDFWRNLLEAAPKDEPKKHGSAEAVERLAEAVRTVVRGLEPVPA